MIGLWRKRIKRFFGGLWYACFESVSRKAPDRSVPSVLILRADGIGDLLFSLPLLETIGEWASPRRTVLVCDQGAESFIQDIDVVDEVIPFDRHRYRWDPIYRWKIWRRVRRVSAETAISLQYHRSPTSDEILRASGSRRTICMSGNNELISDADMTRFNALFSRVVDVPEGSPELVRYQLLGASEGWGTVDWDASYGDAFGGRSGSDAQKGKEVRGVVGLAPGSSSALRRWPLDRWVGLAQELAESQKYTCVLVGGLVDREVIDTIANAVSAPITKAIGNDVLEVAGLLRSIDLLVGLDSGLSHLGARLGVPTIVILGGGHFTRYFPYGSASTCYARQDCYECNWRCSRDQVYCLTEITVGSVRSEIDRRLLQKLQEVRG